MRIMNELEHQAKVVRLVELVARNERDDEAEIKTVVAELIGQFLLDVHLLASATKFIAESPR